MTRETKIGLLVGLAFIIVIGILLSDHLTVTTEPPQAALVQAGQNVRNGVTVPGVSNASVQTPAQSPANVIPQQPVLTQQDLRQPLPTEQIDIRIGAAQGTPVAQGQPSGNLQQIDQLAMSQHMPANPVQSIILPQDNATLPPALQQQAEVRLPGDVESHPVQQLAQQLGAPIEQLGTTTANNTQVAQTETRDTRSADTIAAREYVAVSGDSLSRIAARMYGSNTREHRDLIIRANPSLKDNPNLIVAGRKYLIPERKVTTTPPSVGELALRPVERTPDRTERTSAVAHYTYTVKPGDTLWKIASDQLGDTDQIATIKSLNKETLKGTDVVRVGMKLTLPGKALSRAD
jgi:nucleoid-associated protein YgaU